MTCAHTVPWKTHSEFTWPHSKQQEECKFSKENSCSGSHNESYSSTGDLMECVGLGKEEGRKEGINGNL